MMRASTFTTALQVCAFAYKFTGKERDTESGLDYFGARYYASNMGRWMSPDWADKPEAVPYSSLGDPQSLNLYQFVRNNPLSNRDSDGHGCPPDCGGYEGDAATDSMGGSPLQGVTINPGPILKQVGIGVLKFVVNTINAVQGDCSNCATIPDATPSNSQQALGMAGAAVTVGMAGSLTGGAAPVEADAAAGTQGVPKSIPAGPTPTPTKAQQAAINEMMEAHGCVDCGTKVPGTKSGNAIGNHNPAKSVNPLGGPQTYTPHCLRCSLREGGRMRAAQAKAAAAAKKAMTPQ